jgi:multidrug efflux pump subunit AcrB
MSLAQLAIEKKTVSYFAAFLIFVAGIVSFFQLGWLEDPEFTVKTAAITTVYPGASAEEVELEVTDRIELKLQEMQEIKAIYSESRPGVSIIKVDIIDTIWADQLPQVWDVVRKKIGDMEHTLPPGAGKPSVGDDFGYVFGFLLAVTGDGFSYAELENYVKELRKELSLVDGVARVDLWGVQDRRIYLDVEQSQLANLGLTAADLQATLAQQNKVVDAGYMDLQQERVRLAPTGAFNSPEDIGELTVTAAKINSNGKDELLHLKDIAKVREGYTDPSRQLLRLNGQPAIAIALAPIARTNVVTVGEAIDKRLAELESSLPVGINVHRVSWQSDSVATSIKDFMINLIEAVVIVLIVLAFSMGIRVGIIIGISGLVAAILGTFVVMTIMGIDLQRVSLGALIIAMGMMVDNAIVVVDGFMVKLKQGVSRTQAAIDAASQPSWPLLGATVVACMAFYPIYTSTASTGEYAGSLFTVVFISLIFSWVLSQTLTPLMCMAMIPDPDLSGNNDVYGGAFYQKFRALLNVSMRYRFPFMGGMAILLILSFMGFKLVPVVFFPESNREQIMIDYWEPEGTRIGVTSEHIQPIEDFLNRHQDVKNISSFIGQGPPRFYLPVNPESPNASYAQLVVNTHDLDGVGRVMDDLSPWLKENYPSVLIRVRRYPVGSFNDWKIEARFSGPAEADLNVLRDLANQAVTIIEKSPYALEVRTNWRDRIKKIVPEYDQAKGRWTGVSRQDLANATKRAFDGNVVGQFRQDDELIPIVVRHTEKERENAVTNLEQLQISSALSSDSVPLSQITRSVSLGWEDPTIWRWDRRRAITVQASPIPGVTATDLRNHILAELEAIELPPGYRLEWDGEFDSSRESQAGLKPGMIPALVIMVFIIIVLFNAFRPPAIIFLVIPFAFIGITFGLLLTGADFGFMAILGAMSLAGMMIKNAIVLLDQVILNQQEGMSPYKAVVEAAVSRLSPVVNAAATTVLGMAPLLQDVFWVAMAVTIMFGLAFGTVLTMVVVPVLYAIFYKVDVEES